MQQQFTRKKKTVHPAVPNSDTRVDASVTIYPIHTDHGSPTFLVEDHIAKQCEGQHLAKCNFVRICCILPSQQVFGNYNIFSLLAKCVLRPDENDFAGRICPAGRSLENPDIDSEEEC